MSDETWLQENAELRTTGMHWEEFKTDTGDVSFLDTMAYTGKHWWKDDINLLFNRMLGSGWLGIFSGWGIMGASPQEAYQNAIAARARMDNSRYWLQDEGYTHRPEEREYTFPEMEVWVKGDRHVRLMGCGCSVQFRGPRHIFPNCIQYSGLTAAEALKSMDEKLSSPGGLVSSNTQLWPDTFVHTPCVIFGQNTRRKCFLEEEDRAKRFRMYLAQGTIESEKSAKQVEGEATLQDAHFHQAWVREGIEVYWNDDRGTWESRAGTLALCQAETAEEAWSQALAMQELHWTNQIWLARNGFVLWGKTDVPAALAGTEWWFRGNMTDAADATKMRGILVHLHGMSCVAELRGTISVMGKPVHYQGATAQEAVAKAMSGFQNGRCGEP